MISPRDMVKSKDDLTLNSIHLRREILCSDGLLFLRNAFNKWFTSNSEAFTYGKNNIYLPQEHGFWQDDSSRRLAETSL